MLVESSYLRVIGMRGGESYLIFFRYWRFMFWRVIGMRVCESCSDLCLGLEGLCS